MNHKHLAEDHYKTSEHVTNGDVASRQIARAQYHATMAQLEALDAIAALLTKQPTEVVQNISLADSISIEQLRAELAR